MSLETLREVFLTIGTMSRKNDVQAQRDGTVPVTTRPILGEKGVGRLSTMRMGMRLRVETATLRDSQLNVLDIDWSLFERNPDLPLEDVKFDPRQAGPKPRPKGTTLKIFALNSEWSLAKLDDIAREKFSRLNDPFEQKARFPIVLSFDGKDVKIPPFAKLILDQAHALVSATFGPADPDELLDNGQIAPGAALQLRGVVNYRQRNRSQPIDLTGLHLRNAASASDEVLRHLGPFELTLYWFNRSILEQVDTIGDKRQVTDLVNQWSGGVMVYRDGFRVGGYGQGADDWLDLDRKALASGGYKVNRAQIIGRLAISSVANPALTDQTNREGLTESPEKTALVHLLKHVIEAVFRPFLNKVESEIQAREPVDLRNVADRVLSQRRTIAATLRVLYQRYPQVKADPDIGGRIDEAMNAIGDMMRSLEEMGEAYNKGKADMTVLAGIGLSVASIAHELRQATSNALELVDGLRRRRTPTDVPKALAPLGAQLRTLLTRLRVLDPLVTSGRQRKVSTDIVDLVTSTVQSAMPVFERDRITLKLAVIRTPNNDDFILQIVPGMVVQVVGNLLDNARYWLGRAVHENPRHMPVALVEIDVLKREIRVSDNGPGIVPAMRETIFDAFVSTKPVGAGLGLGLYISREIAGYSGARLELLSEAQTAPNMTTTFALRFDGTAK